MLKPGLLAAEDKNLLVGQLALEMVPDAKIEHWTAFAQSVELDGIGKPTRSICAVAEELAVCGEEQFTRQRAAVDPVERRTS